VAWPRSRDLLFKFWDPLISPEGLMMQTSTFACGLKVRDTKPEYEKWVKGRRGLGHVTYYSNFGTPLISPEWLKIQTSNFACELKVRDTKPKNKKWVKRGRGLGHVTYFSMISLELLKVQTSNLARRLIVSDTKRKKWKINWPKGGVDVVTWPTLHILGPCKYLWNGWGYKPKILHAH